MIERTHREVGATQEQEAKQCLHAWIRSRRGENKIERKLRRSTSQKSRVVLEQDYVEGEACSHKSNACATFVSSSYWYTLVPVCDPPMTEGDECAAR